MTTTTDYSSFCDRLGDSGLVAIVRMRSADEASTVGGRLLDAGLPVLEISFNTPDAPVCIAELRKTHPESLIGAGTVLSAAQARTAADAGAAFLLSPAYVDAVADAAADLALPYIPGAFTAGDVVRCLGAGLDVIKIFPAAPLGPAGLGALLEPFPEVRSVPTGGIREDSVEAWLRAGALALGIGGTLTKAAHPEEAARALRRAVSESRAAH